VSRSTIRVDSATATTVLSIAAIRMVRAVSPKKAQGCSRRCPWNASRRRYMKGAPALGMSRERRRCRRTSNDATLGPRQAGGPHSVSFGRSTLARSPRGGGRHTVRCLITGGAGFLGSHLTDRLLDAGHEVIVFDNLITGR